MANKYSKQSNEKLMQKSKETCRIINSICAAILCIIVLLYFCDFFRLSIDGTVENKISGFKMSFLLFGNSLNDKNNILYFINKDYSGTIKFASISSLLCLVGLLAILGVFIYRVVQRKPILSKFIFLLCSLAVVLLIMQAAAYGSLTSAVTQNYYSGCATCIAQSYNYMPFIFFIILIMIYFIAAYRIYYIYGITFDVVRPSNKNTKSRLKKK